MNRQSGVVLLILSIFCTACIHAKTTGDGLPKKRDVSGEKVPAAQTVAKEGAAKKEPGQPTLAHSEKESRYPGGGAKIGEALKKRGYLDSSWSVSDEVALTGAVRAFQADQKIARTGHADRETLQRLGLDPEKLDKLDVAPNADGAIKNTKKTSF